MKRRALKHRYGRPKTMPAIPPGRDILGGLGGRYEVTVGPDVVYRGDSSQKAHAVFKHEVAHSKTRHGDNVYLMDFSRDDEPIREYRRAV